jgi:Flp pilus assembly protein TadG
MTSRPPAFGQPDPHRQPHPHRDERGLMSVELAILAPVVIVMLLAVVALGRVTQGRALVDQAAAAAARAASLARSPAQAQTDAVQAAGETLAAAGLSCAAKDVTIELGGFHPGGQVRATVRCDVDLSAMTWRGLPGSLTLTASSTSPLESWRDLPGGPTP